MMADQIRCQFRQTIVLTFRPTVRDQNIVAFDIAGFIEAFSKCGQPMGLCASRRAAEKSNHRHCRLLRPRRERPRGRRAAEQRDEVAPLHSITSSARASSLSGISMPSALAVLMLITSSNFVG